MRLFVAVATLIAFAMVIGRGASAKQAEAAERTGMAASIAQYIADGDYGRSEGRPNPFQSKNVEIGAAVIVSRGWALADWRVSGGSVHGQVYFFYLCDHWNVGIVKTHAIRSTDLINATGREHVPVSAATELTRELAAAEVSQVSYIRVPKASAGC